MIKVATLDDLDAFMALGRQMHAESRYCDLPFSAYKLAHVFAGLVAGVDGIVLMAMRDGLPVGFLMGEVRELWFSDARTAYEYGIFVQPEHRGSMCAAQMVKHFGRWALEHGAVIVDLGISTEVTEERTGKFYERLGFKRAGSLFSMRG